ncbi:hypothetical protein pb186bvf_009909 [Paramecium bursaria]
MYKNIKYLNGGRFQFLNPKRLMTVKQLSILMINKQKGSQKQTNWIDDIKDANDPEALADLYIKNLKEEIKLLESEAKILQQKLKIYDPYQQKKEKVVVSIVNTKSQVKLGEKSSDFAKYPTKQKLSTIFANDNVHSSSAVKTEYMKELEQLSEQLKKQNGILKTNLARVQMKQAAPPLSRSKVEGFDLIDGSKLLLGKNSQLQVSKIHHQTFKSESLKPDNTLQDRYVKYVQQRMIQNLLEERDLLQQEVNQYKQSPLTRSKLEGYDHIKEVTRKDVSSIVYGAKLKYLKSNQSDEKHFFYNNSCRNLKKKINIIIQILKNMADIEETLNRIQTHSSVQGIVICNNDGQIIRTSYVGDRQKEGDAIARIIPGLAAKAKSTVRDLDQTNELTFLRIKSKKNEIMVAPDKEFLLIVVQGPKEVKKDEQQE